METGATPALLLALDVAINPVMAVRVAAIDVPGFGHDESRVMHRQQFAALVVNQRLHSMFADRGKDLSDRGRDQGCLPWPGIERTVLRCGRNAPAESGRATPSIRRSTARRSRCAPCDSVRERKSQDPVGMGRHRDHFRARISLSSWLRPVRTSATLCRCWMTSNR